MELELKPLDDNGRPVRTKSGSACKSVSTESLEYKPSRALQLTAYEGVGLSSFRA